MKKSLSDKLLGIGSEFKITPSTALSRSYNTFCFEITLPEDGLETFDSIAIVCASNIDRWQFAWPDQYWGSQKPWQIDDPKADAYITASSSRTDANITINIGTSGGFKPFQNEQESFIKSLHARFRYLLEVSADKKLEHGDKIIIKWGDNTFGSQGTKAPATAKDYFFLPFRFSLLPETDDQLPIKDGTYSALPKITVTGKNADRFHVSSQPLIGVGQQFTAQISAIDDLCNADINFSGSLNIEVENTDDNFSIKKTIKILPEQRGSVLIENLSVSKAGWYKINVRYGNITSRSNYIIASEEPPKNRIYFGDIHCHPIDCDATVGLADNFDYARRTAGLDFLSITSHAEFFGCKKAWRHYLETTEANNKDGEFVTFFGYEWAGQGHINVYFLNPAEAVLFYNPEKVKESPPDQPPFRKPVKPKVEKLMKAVASLDVPVFSAGHCHSWEMLLEDEVVSLFEIHSVHRCDSEDREREPRYRKCLESGQRIGICASSDNHRLPAGHMLKNPGQRWPSPHEPINCYQTAGLHALFAPILNRKNLYHAVKARHSYGTDGERIILILESNGCMMGDTVKLKPSEKPEFLIKVGGTEKISEINLHKFSAGKWQSYTISSNIDDDKWQGTWRDDDYQGPALYYVFVKQTDLSRAWSSPMWFE